MNPPEQAAPVTWRRLLPLALIGLGAALAFWLLRDQISFAALERNREALLAWRDANHVLAALGFMGAYALAVAFSAPGAVWFTLAGGLLFGTIFGAVYVVVAATVGATAIFLAAKTGLGDALRAKAGGWLKRVEESFQENEVSFMLAMRLVPAVPFFVANLAPAFLGVRTVTFIWTTFVGIIPGTLVYASVGAGLGEVFARGEQPDLGVIFEWPVLGPLMGLAALSLLPVALKALRKTKRV
ncbi:MAG: hypothetical protein CVT86_00730 [Alphaproteobacteria bacterium HGW-Alphaproteobacteria-8]|jgi:uncharacterized membrane protein YdjX (TVP38/TMEM64 family)|nr:MAG: hypothetical protein CVT86_00730 [Alphaproteobacteria bacterium HGW-Alphaproteobacteria-8]